MKSYLHSCIDFKHHFTVVIRTCVSAAVSGALSCSHAMREPSDSGHLLHAAACSVVTPWAPQAKDPPSTPSAPVFQAQDAIITDAQGL